jgi:hypothetical protein
MLEKSKIRQDDNIAAPTQRSDRVLVRLSLFECPSKKEYATTSHLDLLCFSSVGREF